MSPTIRSAAAFATSASTSPWAGGISIAGASTTTSDGASRAPTASTAAAIALAGIERSPGAGRRDVDRRRGHGHGAVHRCPVLRGDGRLDLRRQGRLVEREARRHRNAVHRQAHLGDGALDDRPGPARAQRFVDHGIDLGATPEVGERDGDVAGGRPDHDSSLAEVTERGRQRRRRAGAVEPGQVHAANAHAGQDATVEACVMGEQGTARDEQAQDEPDDEPKQHVRPTVSLPHDSGHFLGRGHVGDGGHGYA